VGFSILSLSYLLFIVLNSSRQEPSGFLLSHPHLITIHQQGKTLRKTNTLWSAAKKEDFFSANRRPGLAGRGIVQKFATQNAYR